MDYKDSQAYQDSLNAKKYSKIAIGAFIGLHIICFWASKARFVNVGQHPFLWILPALALGAVLFTVVEVRKNAEITELNKWPYIATLFLMWASCWALFYCGTC